MEKTVRILLRKFQRLSKVTLFAGVHTVDTHRKNMLQKFNVHNTLGLMNVVHEMGLL
jgi:DNA-binding CsgD family transcriptional regulator